MNKNSLFKKSIFAGLVMATAFSLTGCESGLQDFAESTLPQAIRDRGEINKQLAADFVTIGALSEKQYESVCDNIEKQVDKYTKTGDNGEMSAQVLSTVAQSVSQYTLGGSGTPSYVVYIDDDNVSHNMEYEPGSYADSYYAYKENDEVVYKVLNSTYAMSYKNGNALSNFIISNYLDVYQFGHAGRGEGDVGATIERPEKKIEPIQLISDDVAKSLNKLTKAEVYILRDDILAQTGESTLDGVIAMVQKAVNEPSKADQQRLLANYFCKAKDDKGNNITLIDAEDQTFDLIQQSKPNDGSKNEPGYDLVIGQYDMEDCIHVRFTEFSQEAYDVLDKFVGQGSSRYFLVPSHDGSWKAYLMQYPVYTINTMTDLRNENNEVMVDFKKSGLGINLMTKQFVKYKSTGVNEFDEMQATAIEMEEGEDYYLTLLASQNNDEEGVASLVVKGFADTVITDTSGVDHKCLTGRVVLRDYLESTYAPAYDSGDDGSLVVFGRKIRFDMSDEFWEYGTSNSNYKDKELESTFNVKQSSLVYKKKGNIAYFVDKDGIKINNTPYLQITDFCDAYKLYKTDVVARLPFIGEDRTTIESKLDEDEKTPLIGKLTCTTEVDSIEPTMMFPSEELGKADFETDSNKKQRFYTITTTKGLFDSALFSGWIDSESSTASLIWWNKYLADRGFLYGVGSGHVLNYLLGNYEYKMSQEGYVVLDLETIAAIKEIYEKEDDQSRLSFMRTVFLLLAWAIIVYSQLLIMLWIFDTNTGFGLDLLKKATGGRWIAVKYEDDIPPGRHKGVQYVTCKKLLANVFLMITIAILMIRVNVFIIIQYMVRVFGNLAIFIDAVIKGIVHNN